MTDPEAEYNRIVSGDEGAITAVEEDLRAAKRKLPGAAAEVRRAGKKLVWLGGGSTSFASRAAGLKYGIEASAAALAQTQGAVATAASAYNTAVSNADHYIYFWRNRPADLPPIVEEIFARVVNAFLISVGVSYNQQLVAVTATLAGEEVDLDQLDEETRAWVEKGRLRNEQWLSGKNSELGPLIPNIAALGDGRGWIPQGLGYDPNSHTLLQSYYTKDNVAYLALIDEITGKKVGEVRLGDAPLSADPWDEAVRPEHAGGVSVDGDDVYVVDSGRVFTYSLSEIRGGSSDSEVDPIKTPQSVSASSYSAMHDGKLYVGSFEKDTDKSGTLYEYTKVGGEWVKTDSFSTPPIVQGVVVRDDEFVFSTSHYRDKNNGSLIVQDRHTSEETFTYPLPQMAEGIVEVDNEIIATYESGAEEYDHIPWSLKGWLRGDGPHKDLWANPYMTKTPLGDLGLAGQVEMDPETLTAAAGLLGEPADVLAKQAGLLDGVHLSSASLGQAPHASTFSQEVNTMIEQITESLRTGAGAVAAAGNFLSATATDHTKVDDFIGRGFNRARLDG